jgi:hypothetical protein
VVRAGKLASLAWLLERYGGAIRADLARYYGRDLADVFRDDGGMTPDACWDLICHLPRESALHSAMAADGQMVVAADGPAVPSLAEFPPVVGALAGIYDLLAALLKVQVARGGGKAPKIAPYPRPVTAADQARRAQARAEFAELDRYLTGG